MDSEIGPQGAVGYILIHYTALFAEWDAGILILVNYNRVLFLKCP